MPNQVLSACVRRVAVAAAIGLPAHSPVAAEDFFAGKTITMSTYAAPGGGQDTYLRLFARHFAKHIPGRPNIVVTNQPGAGGLLALNHAGKVAGGEGNLFLPGGAGGSVCA